MDSTPWQAPAPETDASVKRSLAAFLLFILLFGIAPALCAQDTAIGSETISSAPAASTQAKSLIESIMVWLPAVGGLGLGICATLLAIRVRKSLGSLRRKV